MHLILTGATGTCGSAVLQHCLSVPSITRLTILSRSPVKQAQGHEKAKVLIHNDFLQYPQTLLDELKGAEGCIWALGISQNAVSKDEYIKITYDYTLAAARAFATLPGQFKFVYVSGEGADPTGRATTLFGKIKGMTEKDLHALSTSSPSLRTLAVRPGLIDPEGEYLRPRPRTMLEVMMQSVMAPVMRHVWKGVVIGTQPLARVLTGLVLGNGEPLPEGEGIEAQGKTLRNIAVRRIAGL